MDIDQLIHRVAEERKWPLLFVEGDDFYKVTVEVPGGRYQDVFVSFRKDDERFWIATIWTVIADAEDFNLTQPLELLRFNWRNLYGSLAVRDAEVVLVYNQLADDADPTEVARAVEQMARTADDLEAQIYGGADER